MKGVAWYLHRLRAMSLSEMLRHARKKWRQRQDRSGFQNPADLKLEPSPSFPRIQDPALAPEILREGLRKDITAIQRGQWRAFGGCVLQVDLPPRWHKDYLAGQDLTRMDPAFQLNHRSLPQGADVKLIWELSRWYHLVRLAQAAHVLGDSAAAGLCLDLLEDWAEKNPPYCGWNWTSALEVGVRLIQFTWIDALLAPTKSEGMSARLAALRQRLLPAHARYAWRHQSFGSSANNHLLGEIVGLVLAVARWPELASVSASLEDLKDVWEREVLAQFAPDGGNREQALNYQLFSFEFAWQAHEAILAAGVSISPNVRSRLDRAARFFYEAQVDHDPWDYGDSDSAYVSPVFANAEDIIPEWRAWMAGKRGGAAIQYWLGDPPSNSSRIDWGTAPQDCISLRDWWLYPQTGIATMSSGFWWMRWDLSPLGYLATAAHGHLDALHLSIWYRGVALVIDPGTGAYYADSKLRSWLASRAAHNAPCPQGVAEWPRRLGPFLWESHHDQPTTVPEGPGVVSHLKLEGHRITRRIMPDETRYSWRVEDRCEGQDGTPAAFVVRWQFAPGAIVRMLNDREFLVRRKEESLRVLLSDSWAETRLVELGDPLPPEDSTLAGTVSPGFRTTERAPFLFLKSGPTRDKSCVFSTTFLASPSS